MSQRKSFEEIIFGSSGSAKQNRKPFEEIIFGDGALEKYKAESPQDDQSATAPQSSSNLDLLKIYANSSNESERKSAYNTLTQRISSLDKKNSSPSGVGENIDYLGQAATRGALSGVKNAGDFLFIAGDNPLSAIKGTVESGANLGTNFINLFPSPKLELDDSTKAKLSEAVTKADEHLGLDSLGLDTSNIKKSWDDTFNTWSDQAVTYNEENLSELQKWGGNIAESIGQNIPSMAISAVTGNPNIGLAFMGASSAGNATSVALSEGATMDEALAYGISTGAVEIATERLFGGIPFFGEGWFDDVAMGWFNKNIKSEAIKQVIKYAHGALGEGFEEYIAGVAGEFLTDLYKNYEGDKNNFGRFLDAQSGALQDALMGAVTGLIMGAPGNIQNVAAGHQVDVYNNQNNSNFTLEDYRNSGGNPATLFEQANIQGEVTADDMIKADIEQRSAENAKAIIDDMVEKQKKTASPQQVIADGLKSNDPIIKMESQRANNETIQTTAKRHNIDTQTAKKVTEVANGLGVRVEFVDGFKNGAEGKYENGTLYIAKNTINPVHEVFKHELTHHLEQTEGYAEFQRTLFELVKKQGFDLDTMSENLRNRYAQAGEILDDAGVASELTAVLTQDKIFTDQNTINDLTKLNPNIAQKILKWIQEKIYYFSEKTESRALMLRAERLYHNALREAQKHTVQQVQNNKFMINTESMRNNSDVLNQNYSKEEIERITRNPNHHILNESNTIEDFLERYKNSPTEQRLYIGKLNKQIVNRLFNDLGVDYEGYSLSISSSGFTHVDSVHGVFGTKALSNPKHITKDIINNVADIIQNYDNVYFRKKGNQNRIEFNTDTELDYGYKAIELIPKRGKELVLYNIFTYKKGTNRGPDTAFAAPSLTATNNSADSLDVPIDSISKNYRKVKNSFGLNTDNQPKTITEDDHRYFYELSREIDDYSADMEIKIRELEDDYNLYLEDCDLTEEEYSFDEYLDENRDMSEELDDLKKKVYKANEIYQHAKRDLDKINSIILELQPSRVSTSRKSISTYLTFPKSKYESIIQYLSDNNIENDNGYYSDMMEYEPESFKDLDEIEVRISNHNVGGYYNQDEDISVSYNDANIKIDINDIPENANNGKFSLGINADEINNIAKKIKDTSLHDYNYYAIRWLTNDENYEVGDIVRNSYDWDYENDISTYYTDNPIELDGASGIDLNVDYLDDLDDIEEKLINVLGNARYAGNRPILIAGTQAEYGADENEIIISDATVIADLSGKDDTKFSRGLNVDNLVDPATQENINKKVSGYNKVKKNSIYKLNGGYSKGNISEIMNEIAIKVVNGEEVTAEMKNLLINEVWDNAYIVDSSQKEAYEGVRDYLSETTLKLTDSIKSEIVDFNAFRRSISRKLRFSKDGQSIDSVYQELQQLYGEMFPDVNSEGEMLEVMADVYNYEQSRATHLSELGVKKEDMVDDIEDALNEFVSQVAYRSDKRYLDTVARKTNKRVIGSYAKAAFDNIIKVSSDVKELLEANEGTVGFKSAADWDGIAPQIKSYGALSKTLSQVLDIVANKSPDLRIQLYNAFEKPLYEAKKGYTSNLKANVNRIYADIVSEYGIKKGSKESAALMHYGEGKRLSGTDSKGDVEYENYTISDLKKEFPESWQKIQAADKVMREIYDDYVDRLNAMLEVIYPNVEIQAQFELDNVKAKIAILEQQKRQYQESGMGTGDAKYLALFENTNRELTAARTRFNNLQKQIKDGSYLQNKRLLKRTDYYHHFNELSKMETLKQIFDDNASNNISNALSGKSEWTKPKARWAGFMQKRGKGSYTEDAVAAILEYIPKAEYKIAFDPVVTEYRDAVSKLVEASNEHQVDNTEFINWMTNYTNDLAGKTNPIDRMITHVHGGRKVVNGLKKLNSVVKANAVMGNLNSAVSQFYNLPNALGILKNKGGIKATQDIQKGMSDYLEYMQQKVNGASDENIINQSVFLAERYIDGIYNQFDEGIAANLRKGAAWTLQVGDQAVAESMWFAAYEQAQRLGIENDIEYADDIVRRAVAGRGVGEIPLAQKSELTKLIAPFQVEVNNAWQLMKQFAGHGGEEKDVAALLTIFVATWIMNNVNEMLTGRRVGADMIDALIDSVSIAANDVDKNIVEKGFSVAGRLTGELLSNMPMGAQITELFGSTDYQREKFFGESDPSRYGTGNIGLQAIGKPVYQFFNGENVDWQSIVGNFLFPYGGKQAERTYKMAEDAGIIPRIDFNIHDFFQVSHKQGAYNDSGELKYQVDVDDPINLFKGLVFGTYATNEGKEYLDEGYNAFSEKKTSIYETMVDYGADKMEAYNALRAANYSKNITDNNGEKIDNSKATLNREALEAFGVYGVIEDMINSGNFTASDFGLNKGVFEWNEATYQEFLEYLHREMNK